jgi:hypothetical protein
MRGALHESAVSVRLLQRAEIKTTTPAAARSSSVQDAGYLCPDNALRPNCRLHMPIAVERDLATGFCNEKSVVLPCPLVVVIKRTFAQPVGTNRTISKWPLVTRMLGLGLSASSSRSAAPGSRPPRSSASARCCPPRSITPPRPASSFRPRSSDGRPGGSHEAPGSPPSPRAGEGLNPSPDAS